MMQFSFIISPVISTHHKFSPPSHSYCKATRMSATKPAKPRPVVVASSLNADISVEVDVCCKAGETVHGKSVSYSLGGKGANAAIAAIRAQDSETAGDVFLAATRGDDAAGLSLVNKLSADGLDLSLLRSVDEAETGTAIIIVEANGENRIIVTAGANAYFSKSLLKDELFWGRLNNAVVVLHLEIPTSDVVTIAKGAQERGGIVVLNPSPVAGLFEVERELLQMCDFVIVNEIEVVQIAGLGNCVEVTKAALEVERKCGAGACVVVTRGKEDVLIVKGGNIETVKTAKAKKVVDTTGAGDTITGYLAASIAHGLGVKEALELAVVAASMTVEKRGASIAIPAIEQVRHRMVGSI